MLKIKLLEEEKEQLKKEVASLHQKLKDQNELNAIKTTRLEEKLKVRESTDLQLMSCRDNDMSVLSYVVPSSKGFGRSQSPKVGTADNTLLLKKEHRAAVKELTKQIIDKDNIIRELNLEKEEILMKISELENTNDYLEEQVSLVHKEKETSIQLLETQLKRQENEYRQQINLMASESYSAKEALSHKEYMRHVNKGEEPFKDSVVKKLTYSV